MIGILPGLRCLHQTRGLTVGVDIVDPETLERSVGKIRRIVDSRAKE